MSCTVLYQLALLPLQEILLSNHDSGSQELNFNSVKCNSAGDNNSSTIVNGAVTSVQEVIPTDVHAVDPLPNTNGNLNESAGNPASTLDPSSIKPEVQKELPIIGYVSCDFSRISEGLIVLIIDSQPLLTLNLLYILGSLSRSSRKKLAVALSQKELPSWPLVGTGNSNENSIKSTVNTDTESTVAADANAVDSKGLSTTSKSAEMLVRKCEKILGITFNNHSNSILDSLRIWMSKNDVKLYMPHATKSNTLTKVDLGKIIPSLVKSLKDSRTSKKTKASNNQNNGTPVNNQGPNQRTRG